MTANSSDVISDIVELNVGGVYYTTTLETLKNEENSFLSDLFTGVGNTRQVKDSRGRYFLDRDGVLFRYVLDYLRNHKVILPENFHERERLKNEAEFFKLAGMMKQLSVAKPSHLAPLTTNDTAAETNTNGSASNGKTPKPPASITVGYRGTFAFGRDGLVDVKFRKLSRILICGKVNTCREVFGETLNESRDPDRGSSDRYTSRYFLKHNSLEQALDYLAASGFRLMTSCGTGTSSNTSDPLKPGADSEESKWNHYNEFVFQRQ